jgi:hypothetical protein
VLPIQRNLKWIETHRHTKREKKVGDSHVSNGIGQMAHQPLSLPLEPPHNITQFMEPIPNFNQNISAACSFAYDRIENELNILF